MIVLPFTKGTFFGILLIFLTIYVTLNAIINGLFINDNILNNFVFIFTISVWVIDVFIVIIIIITNVRFKNE
jgi:hypothetical protein